MEDGRVGTLDEILKAFSQRAAEAEERITRLEAAVSNEHAANGKDLHLTDNFRSQLEIVQLELASEREKASKEINKLVAENAKLQYRITHLIRALREADTNVGINL